MTYLWIGMCVAGGAAMCANVWGEGGLAGVMDVQASGASGDGLAMDTGAVQRAIDACAEGGGGTVHFGPGTYLCGSLHLRSGGDLELGARGDDQGEPGCRGL